MPSIMPKLTPHNPSPAATAGGATAARTRIVGARAGDSDAFAKAFPTELSRAKTRNAADVQPERPTEPVAKRPEKAGTSKKAKASKRTAEDVSEEAGAAEGKVVKAKKSNTAHGSESVDEASDADPTAEVDDSADASEAAKKDGDDDGATDANAATAAAAVAAAQKPADASEEAGQASDDTNAGSAEGETPADPNGIARIEGLTGQEDGEPTAENASAEEGGANASHAGLADRDAAAAAEEEASVELKPRRSAAKPGAKPEGSQQPDPSDASALAFQVGETSQAGSSPSSSADDVHQMVDALGRHMASAAEGAAPQPAVINGPAAATGPTSPARPEMPPEARFAEANHANVVSSMRSQLLPNGGTMRMRLDPPQLGAMQVVVHMRDGVMSASFETSTDEATKLLSHSLAQLKGVLESQGVSVEKLQVQQGPREAQSTGRNDNQQQEQPGGQQQREATREEQQEHQRREMMRRVWKRLSGAADPLDVTG